ncbi:MAG TPA: PepSY-like domain-containing protein [Saprospiraceae bacterium]|nr:PepSY-like domain-containing protein [Saprospiraceae bacterium]HMQ82131.1 PepSY-like domain-containing protein [Saprospiraceae bacterium]
MKIIRLFVVLGLAAEVFSCSKDTLQNSQIPEPVMQAFQQKHADAQAVKWYKAGDNFQAEYQANGLDREVVLNAKGGILLTETALNVNELPASILNYLSAQYGDQTITEAEKIETPDGLKYEVEYKIGGQEVELLFDAQGNFLQQGDDEEAGEEQDEEED